MFKSFAPFAIEGIAVGILTLGGISIGNYSIGGVSIGKYVSIGGYSNGHIAIGHHVNGNITPIKPTSNELKRLILDNYPNNEVLGSVIDAIQEALSEKNDVLGLSVDAQGYICQTVEVNESAGSD